MPGDRPHSSWLRRWRLALARFDAGLTIAFKLAVPVLVPGIVVVTVATGIVYRMEAARIRSDFEERALLLTQGVEVTVRGHGSTELDTQLVAEVQDHLDGLAQMESSVLLINAYVVEDGQPRIIASSDPGRIVSPADAAQDVSAFYSLSAVVHEEKLAGERALEVNLPVRLGGEPAVVLAAFFSTAERDSALAALLWTFGLAGGGGLVVALAALFLTFRVLVYRRLRRLMAAAERMQRGDYGARVEGVLPPEARDEMLRLSARFNEMAEAIQRAEEALRESEERTRSIIETSYEAFISIDSAGVITDWNRQAEVTFGWRREEAIGRPLAETLIPPRYREPHLQGLQRFLATGEGPVLNKRIEFAALHRDGHELPVELAVWPVRTRQGWIFNALVHDITERKQAEEALRALHEKLEERATTDPLTGLYNRRYVTEALEREIPRARRQGHPLAVILLDVDMLKELNDRCGHAAGDDALRQLGAVLRRSVRESDVLARFGGDEFLILLPDCKGSRLRSALDRIQREMERLEVRCGGDGHVLPVTVSAGGALLREGDTAESLLYRADQALYEAKRAGRSRTRVAA